LADGRAILSLFRNMGLPGILVATCFGFGSTSFVIALQHTTVATILFVQSTSPLIAGTLAWIWLGERTTWIRSGAMVLALAGVAIMVSDSSGHGDALGIALSIVIAFAIATATVTVRRYSEIRMTPATCLSAMALACLGFTLGTPGDVSGSDIFLLFLFGTVQLAFGFILFTSGARLIPAGETILIGLLEAILAPLWVWLWPGINEYPGDRAVIGGLIVIGAVVLSTTLEMGKVKRIAPPIE
jgi:drug/metabolite transporter (DMT)-like permease